MINDQSAGPCDSWEGVPAQLLAQQWNVPQVSVHLRVGSTNDLARTLAESGAAAGTCVIAEEQLAGRGRERRSWSSPPRLGVWMSIILRPDGGQPQGAAPILVGLAAARALDPFCKPHRVQLKWPNDLLLGGRKLGGILCESTWDGSRPSALVAGIGLNVLHAIEDFPAELRGIATSIRIACGWSPSRVELAGAVVRAVLAVSSTPTLTTELREELADRDALRGRAVSVTVPGGARIRGVAVGFDRDGSLRLRLPNGAAEQIRTGTVRLDSPGSG